MPIYEYECSKCGHITEAWQKFSDKPLSKCELCSGNVKKLISQNNFHLKGSGWYVTDYASKSGGNQGTGSSKESKPSQEHSKGKENKSPKKNNSGTGDTGPKKDS